MHLACLYADDYQTLKTFIYSYVGALPCVVCRKHFEEVLAQVPFPSESENLAYFKWSVDVHNIVNNRLGKPRVSYDDALREWASGCGASPDYDKWAPLKVRIALLLLIIIVAILFFRVRN